MAMPETSMHENSLLLPDHYEIRFSRQITDATAVPKSHSSHNVPHRYLGACALRANPAHYLAAFAIRECVHYVSHNVGQTLDERYHFGNVRTESSGFQTARLA
jgi:hypothetical protein